MTREEAILCIKGIKNLGHDMFTEQKDFQECLDMAIKALEQEPCEDAVSRRAVLDTLDKMDSVLDEDRTVETYKELLAACYNDLPPVTPAHKTGRWIFVDKAHEHGRCSECDYGNVDLVDGRPHNYCPNCGAKIESEEK